MDVTLFTRTSRMVELTEAGRSFQPRVRELMVRLASDPDEALRVLRGESGRIDLAFISSAAGELGSVLCRFTRQRPGVLVQLHEGFTATVLDRLECGTADAGIVRDAEERDGITVSTSLEEPFVAVFPANHALAACRTVPAARSTIQIVHRTNDDNPLVRAFQALVVEGIDGSYT